MKTFLHEIKKMVLLAAVLLGFAATGRGQVSFNSTGVAYTQDFNTLETGTGDKTWTDNTSIAGWYLSEASYKVTTGSSTTGGLYSCGTGNSDEDRALGALSTGTNSFAFAVRVVNNTGAAVSRFQISYKGEQWKQTANDHALSFSYKVGATAIGDDTWTSFSALDFTALKTGSGALDGNAEGNYSTISSTVDVTVNNGQEIWFKWNKSGGSSPIMAIDDISITALLPSTAPSVIGAPKEFSFGGVRKDKSVQQTFTLTPANLSTNLQLTTKLGGGGFYRESHKH